MGGNGLDEATDPGALADRAWRRRELSGLCLGLMLLFFYSVLVDDARYRTCQSWLCER